MKNFVFLFILLFGYTNGQLAFASDDIKGTLPEVKLNSENEDDNQIKSLKSETMITNAENRAIVALQKVIQKRKGSKEEPDLLFRLAELYMRRAKSGRFFDLQEKTVRPKSALDSLNNAILIYNRIQQTAPKFARMDEVLFNNALANSQTAKLNVAIALYTQLISDFPKSPLLPDALLEVGELEYNNQRFQQALNFFLKIDQFPLSRAYPYGLYKSAWSYYNLKQTDEGISRLVTVIKKNKADEQDQKKYDLRKEALRDLTLFVGESKQPSELYAFFDDLATPIELGEVILNLAKLYESHSRYKEISIFAKEYIEKNPESALTPPIYVKLIDTNETLKKRDLVISDLKKMALFCKKTIADDNCPVEFRKISLDISKKWWEIWLKNKTNVEFSSLTEQAFEILLEQENSTSPDSTSRYAYAELLFQQNKFSQALTNYESVSNNPKLDSTRKHDSLYAALFCIEKQLESKPQDESQLVLRQKSLASRYLTEFPTGEHADQLSFKLGFIAYKEQDLELALKQLTPFTSKTKNLELKTKAEDILLDIYNLKKDFVGIKQAAQNFLTTTTDAKRKATLSQLIEESHYSDIQKQSETLDPQKKIAILKEFSEKYQNTKLSKDAAWQVISLAYSNGFDVMGADLSIDFAKKYPDDKKNVDSIKEALKSYVDSGHLAKAITTSRELAKLDTARGLEHLETSCDLMHVNSQLTEARGCYKGLFEKSDKVKKTKLLAKMMTTFKDQKNLAELATIENQILQENIEPYATKILINRARNFFDVKKFTEAFNASSKINSRDVDADLRAEARLIQAQILEREFVTQSLKAKESKFALVLGLKTEKLDKTFTAFSTTIKMSKETQIQAQALQGIDRIYLHFIESVSNMPIPETLSPTDQQSLRQELVKLTEPFVLKRTENLAKLRKVTQLSAAQSEDINWSEFSPEKTIEPRLRFPSAKLFKPFLPTELALKGATSRLPASVMACKQQEVSAQSIGGCIQSRKLIEAEKLSLSLTQTKDQRAIGLYYLGVIADQKNEVDKSQWMFSQSLKLDPDASLTIYQLAKVTYSVDGLDSALPLFEKIIDIKKNSPEIGLLSGLKAFSDRDYLTTIDEFSRFTPEELYNYKIGELMVESYAQKGDPEGAKKWAGKFIAMGEGYVDMYLQLARVIEQFELNKDGAVPIYEKALSKSVNSDQKEWIRKKISFLKTKPTENQITKLEGVE